jgi:hypothetical protein
MRDAKILAEAWRWVHGYRRGAAVALGAVEIMAANTNAGTRLGWTDSGTVSMSRNTRSRGTPARCCRSALPRPSAACMLGFVRSCEAMTRAVLVAWVRKICRYADIQPTVPVGGVEHFKQFETR